MNTISIIIYNRRTVLFQKGKNFGAGKFLPFCVGFADGSAIRRSRGF
jgi:hypothetical protein